MTVGTDAPPRRRTELDVLRIVLVLGLVLFHSALVFDTHDDFYVKNDATAELTGALAGPIVIWAMPSLFAIAGIAARYSLRRRSPGAFVRERLLRLGLPLLVVTVLLTPIPQWIRARTERPDVGYPEFLLEFFTVHLDPVEFPFVLQGEWFEFGHLWFVVLLLVWSLVLALLVAVVPPTVAVAMCDGVRRAVDARPVALLLPIVASAIVGAALPLEQGFAAWNRWSYLLFFLAGFALLGDDAIRAAVRRAVLPAAVAAIVLFAGGMAIFVTAGGQELFVETSAAAAGFRALYGATGWCTVLAILGGLDRLATRRGEHEPGPVLRYLGPVALPIYLLHQPIVVVLASFIIASGLPAGVEFALIVVGSFAVLFAVLEPLRRIPLARTLLGMPSRSADRST